MRVTIDGVTMRLDGRDVLRDAHLDVRPGEIVGVIGPNGSGKSSLLRTVYRALRPVTGSVVVGDAEVWTMSPRESARRTAAVVQESVGQFDLTVADVVAMGRNPHSGPFGATTEADLQVCHDALARTGMSAFEKRPFDTLSGGEKQRVQLARALAQQSQVLVLDEPTNHLDVRHQLDLLDLVREVGLTTLAALHDLTLAARWCDRVLVLNAGQVAATGIPDDVLTEDVVRDVFGVDLVRFCDPATGRRYLGVERLTHPGRVEPLVGASSGPADGRRL
ncbi:MAG: ABC transporter ATP-binding protein [Dermatophilaceae bacterium]